MKFLVDANLPPGQCYYVRRLAFFGSVLRADLGPESDVDVLVESNRGAHRALASYGSKRGMSELLGHEVDLHTCRSLSRYFRDDVLREAEVKYEERAIDSWIRPCGANLVNGQRRYLRRQRIRSITWVYDPEVREFQILQRARHGGRESRRIRVLDLDGPVLAVFLPEEVHLGSGMRRPEGQFLGALPAGTRRNFERKALPRSTEFVVGGQIALGADRQQGMQ